MPNWNAFSYAFGPVVAFLGIGAMVLMLRWAFKSGQSVVARPAKVGTPSDYGILVPIASPPTYIEGEVLRRTLVDAGIRANLATTTEGPRVLVWPADVDNARAILRRGVSS